MIIAVGDGLAEPIGVYLGRHKYLCLQWFSKRRYLRSWEGSMCVFLSAMDTPLMMVAGYLSLLGIVLVFQPPL